MTNRIVKQQRLCSIEGCNRKHHGNGLCDTHYKVQKRNGDPLSARPKRLDGTGSIDANGYISHNSNGEHKREHVLVVERILGKTLPPKAEVHHLNGNPSDNSHSNLVVCPNHWYHRILHYRQRALDASGNANFMYCAFCKTFDDPNRMYVYPKKNVAMHRECGAKYARDRRTKKGT
jgi:hypothetical protein